MDNLSIAGFIVGGFIAVVLVILGLRGRFGTPNERADFDLNELANSDEVPRKATRRETANCRGHDLGTRQLIGTGVLWLTDDTLGFVLRTPRRHLTIPRATILSARVDSKFQRPGIEEESDEVDFVIVSWETPSGAASVVFQLPDPQVWVDDLLS